MHLSLDLLHRSVSYCKICKSICKFLLSLVSVNVFTTLPCGGFVFLALSRRLVLRRLLRHHQHNTSNTTPSTQHLQHYTIYTTSSKNIKNNIINTTSTQQPQHYTIYTTSSKTTSSTLHHGAPQSHLAWQVQHAEHIQRRPQKSGDD